MATADEIRAYVDELFSRVNPLDDPTVVLGSGGTFVTLGAVARNLTLQDEALSRLSIPMDELVGAVDRIAAMTPAELAELPAVPAARAEVLRAGVICAERAAAQMSAHVVQISISDILDGIALELASIR